MNSKQLHKISFVLVIIGALNWGLIGLFSVNLVDMLIGSWPMLENLVYILVGLSAAYLYATHQSYCKICTSTKKK